MILRYSIYKMFETHIYENARTRKGINTNTCKKQDRKYSQKVSGRYAHKHDANMHTNLHAHTCTHAHQYIHKTYTYMHAKMHTNMCAHTCTHVHTYEQTYTRKCTRI